jgi:hypothetical protein
VSTVGWRLTKTFIAENGRTTAGGVIVAACQLCDNETTVDRLVTTVHLGEMLVCCRACRKGTPDHYVSRDR